jgi:hypothetical protein
MAVSQGGGDENECRYFKTTCMQHCGKISYFQFDFNFYIWESPIALIENSSPNRFCTS